MFWHVTFFPVRNIMAHIMKKYVFTSDTPLRAVMGQSDSSIMSSLLTDVVPPCVKGPQTLLHTS